MPSSLVPPELIEWVSKAGAVAAPIFMFLWWDERSDRRELQKKLDQNAERTITAMVESKALLQTVIDIFNRGRQ
jgi:hypothetical protein